jgi:hypothetical protein
MRGKPCACRNLSKRAHVNASANLAVAKRKGCRTGIGALNQTTHGDHSTEVFKEADHLGAGQSHVAMEQDEKLNRIGNEAESNVERFPCSPSDIPNFAPHAIALHLGGEAFHCPVGGVIMALAPQ